MGTDIKIIIYLIELAMAPAAVWYLWSGTYWAREELRLAGIERRIEKQREFDLEVAARFSEEGGVR